MGNNVLDILKERGLMQMCSDFDSVRMLLSESKICAYLGIDATAPALHVGHLLPLMVALHLMKAGHKVVILLGGATTRIGDPSGKDKTRPTLDEKTIADNCKSIETSLRIWLESQGCANNVVFDNNANWFDNIGYINFLRDYGKYFSVNEMLTLTSVKERLDRQSPMNFVEFNYVLLQSYDFYELNKRHNCVLQIGGSDQWGNIAHGISLGKRLGISLYGLIVPLLTTADGRKMGKTEGGAVWLDKSMLSSYEYWQFFRNVEDANTSKWWGYFTFDQYDDKIDINQSKSDLATRATSICRGEHDAIEARKHADMVFGKIDNAVEAEYWTHDRLVDYATKHLRNERYDAQELSALPKLQDDSSMCAKAENVYFTGRETISGQTISHVIKEMGFAASMGSAKDLIREGAVKVNGQTIKDVHHVLTRDYFIPGNRASISVGKKRHGVLLSNCHDTPCETDKAPLTGWQPDVISRIAGLGVEMGYPSNIQDIIMNNTIHLDCYTAKITTDKSPEAYVETNGMLILLYLAAERHVLHQNNKTHDIYLVNPGYITNNGESITAEISLLVVKKNVASSSPESKSNHI